MGNITVENIHNGAKSTFTTEQWDKVKGKKEWLGTFRVVEEPKVKIPAELLEDEKPVIEKDAVNTAAEKADKPKAGK